MDLGEYRRRNEVKKAWYRRFFAGRLVETF